MEFSWEVTTEHKVYIDVESIIDEVINYEGTLTEDDIRNTIEKEVMNLDYQDYRAWSDKETDRILDIVLQRIGCVQTSMWD